MRAALALVVLCLAACGSGGASKPTDPHDLAVGKTSGAPPGASAAPPCDARGTLIGAEDAEGKRIVERCVTGASPETKAAIEKALTLGTDKVLTADALRRDLEAVWTTGLVDQIEATARPAGSGVVLFLAVTERTRVANVSIDGLDPTMAEHRSVASLPKVGAPLDVPLIQTLCENLRAAHASAGWEDAKVSHAVSPADPGTVRLKIVVAPGPRSKVGKVTFDGARGGRDTQLRAAIELENGSVLTADKLEHAGLLANSFYWDRGFMNVKVDEPKRVRATDGTTAITFKITEGPVFRIGKLSASGVDAAVQAEVLAGITVKTGEIFNRSKLKADLTALESRPRPSGKTLAFWPETKLDPKAGTVDIVFAVKEQ